MKGTAGPTTVAPAPAPGSAAVPTPAVAAGSVAAGSVAASLTARSLALLDDLRQTGVRFVQWKSTLGLPRGLAGEDDLDLLVRRQDAGALERVLAAHGLKRAVDADSGGYPGVHQYFGYLVEHRRWLHVDVYFALTTGSSYLKEYRLPLERPLLAGGDTLHGVPVPEPAAELVTLVIGQAIKRSSLLQVLTGVGLQDLEGVRQEIGALHRRDPAASERATLLLAEHLPEVEPELWRACLVCLTQPSTTLQRYLAGNRLRGRLRAYRRFGRLNGALRRAALLAGSLTPHGRRGGKRLATGGAVIALVGPEATGKSTLTAALAERLGEYLEVVTAHLGKPPATAVTAPVSLLLPLLRRLAPSRRPSVAPTRVAAPAIPAAGTAAPSADMATHDATARTEAPDGEATRHDGVSALVVVRSLMLAYERLSLASRLARRAANGAVVLCDRYPSPTVGAMDSARLDPVGLSGWRQRAARLERRLYLLVPRPSLVVKLSVPVEVAVQRNRDRIKDGKESDDYVVHRHTNQAVPGYPGVPVVEVDTGEEREAVTARLEDAVWRFL